MKSVSLRTMTLTGGSLILLWAASFGLSYVELGSLSLVVALAIAVLKAGLVGLFFMELIVEPFTVNITLITAVTMIAVLIALMILDVELRAAPPLRVR